MYILLVVEVYESTHTDKQNRLSELRLLVRMKDP